MRYFIIFNILISMLYGYNNQKAQSNLANDYAKCAVFFYLSYERASKINSTKTANKMKQLSENAATLTKRYSNRTSANIRMHIEMDKQYTLVNKKGSYSTLLREHGKLCKLVMLEPDRRFRYWLSKRD